MTTPQNSETPLWLPLYGASFGDAVRRFFRKYTDFTGRASRSEFWWWWLLSVLIAVVFEILLLTLGNVGGVTTSDGTRALGPISWILLVAYLIWVVVIVTPSIALIWRRLHDANLAGPFFFLGFIPVIGGILLLVFYLLPSKPEGARFDRQR
ncbi:DUF805 domain-containing protein [Leifsonia poae]|uniref:DUF805 domain-containing protein n=1 Tax=Leifsonia poae TaxID=110933 RepID=UPI003D673A98